MQDMMGHRVQQEEFDGERPKVLATGGFASLFHGTGLFDQVIPDLVLRGLITALSLNPDTRISWLTGWESRTFDYWWPVCSSAVSGLVSTCSVTAPVRTSRMACSKGISSGVNASRGRNNV